MNNGKKEKELKKKERKKEKEIGIKKEKKTFKNDFFHCRKIWTCDLQVSNQQASH